MDIVDRSPGHDDDDDDKDVQWKGQTMDGPRKANPQETGPSKTTRKEKPSGADGFQNL
jgi:hypothetical protein